MTSGVRIEGMDKALSNLNKEIAGLKERSMRGLLAGGLFIQRGSQQRVSVEYGNLRASAYTRKVPEVEMAVEVGYEAAYALFVHENLEMKLEGQPRPSGLGKYWGPKGEAKFLEKELFEKQGEVLAIIAKHSKF